MLREPEGDPAGKESEMRIAKLIIFVSFQMLYELALTGALALGGLYMFSLMHNMWQNLSENGWLYWPW